MLAENSERKCGILGTNAFMDTCTSAPRGDRTALVRRRDGAAVAGRCTGAGSVVAAVGTANTLAESVNSGPNPGRPVVWGRKRRRNAARASRARCVDDGTPIANADVVRD